MLYDTSASPNERRAALGLPCAPDAKYAAQWDSMGVTSQLVVFSAPYTSLEHVSARRDAALCQHMMQPDAVTTSSLLEKKEKLKVEIDRERARRNGETYREPPPLETDQILGGPTFLYREPKVRTKPQVISHYSTIIPTSASSRPSMLDSGMSCHFVEDDKSRAVRECRIALSEALRAKKPLVGRDEAMNVSSESAEHTGKFFDASFFSGSRDALYPNGVPPTVSIQEPADARRLTVLFPEALVFDPEPTPYAIVSTTLRAHHFVAAMEALRQSASGRALLMNLLVSIEENVSAQDFLFDHGMIGVLLFVDGKWDWVIIDDIVPVDSSARVMFLSTVPWSEVIELEDRFGCAHTVPNPKQAISWEKEEPQELWPILLLKAAAKRLGCYAALDGGLTSDAVTMLTGFTEMPSTVLSPGEDGGFDLLELLHDTPSTAVLLYPRATATRGKSTVTSNCNVLCCCEMPCWISNVDWENNLFSVYSPWGCLRRKSSQGGSVDEVHHTMEIDVSSLSSIFEVAEVYAPRTPIHPMVEFHALSNPTDAVRFSIGLATAIRTDILFNVEQADPKVQRYLPYEARATLPLCCMSWTICNVAQEVVFHKGELVRRQTADLVGLESGQYVLEVRLNRGPAVPFRVSVSAPSTAAVTISLHGTDPEVHGVSTRTLQGSALPAIEQDKDASQSPQRLLHEVMNRRASRLLRPSIPDAVQDAVNNADILQRGTIGYDAATRAFLELMLTSSPGGVVLAQHLQQASSSGGVDVTKFYEALRTASREGFHLPADW